MYRAEKLRKLRSNYVKLGKRSSGLQAYGKRSKYRNR
jgi:hypothetical protein